MTFHLVGNNKSSQLTNSYFSEGQVYYQPGGQIWDVSIQDEIYSILLFPIRNPISRLKMNNQIKWLDSWCFLSHGKSPTSRHYDCFNKTSHGHPGRLDDFRGTWIGNLKANKGNHPRLAELFRAANRRLEASLFRFELSRKLSLWLLNTQFLNVKDF